VGSRARACFFLSARLTRAALTSPMRDKRRLSGATLCPKGRQRVCQTWLHADTPPRGQRAMARFSLVSQPGLLTMVDGGLAQTTLCHQQSYSIIGSVQTPCLTTWAVSPRSL
jgi:hypothetical protein